MGLKVYGYSDDNVCWEGDISDEVGCFRTDLVLTFSDGTKLRTHYGKGAGADEEGIWTIEVVAQGSLIDRIEFCHDAEAEIYSDIVYFKDGITKIESRAL